MKKFLLVFFLIPIFSLLQAQNDSAYFDNIGFSYHIDQNHIVSNDSLFVVLKSREAPPANKWLPTDLAGATPEDIFFVEDESKLYIYGKRNILVVDPSTNTITNQIYVSNLSQYYPAIENTHYLNYNHFAYNPNDKLLYCILEDASVIAIDVESSSDDFTQVISTPPACANLKYNNYFLKYNDLNDWIYYVISSDATNELIVYDASDYTLEGGISFNNPSRDIRGIEVSESRNEFYLSVDKLFLRYQFDPTIIINEANVTKTQIGAYSNSNTAGNMVLVDDATNSIDKLFCFPNRINNTGNESYFILDFSTGSITTKTCPIQITSAIYDMQGNVIISNRTDASQNDLTFINGTNYSTVANLNTQSSTIDKNNATLDMDLLNGKVLIAKESEIVTVDPSSNYDVDQVLEGESNYFSRIATTTIGAYVNGVWSTDLIKVTTSGSYVDNLDVGGMVYYACYSPVNEKIYFYNKHRQGRSKVYVYNTSSEDITIIDFESAINDIEINPVDNNALVSTEESSSKIKVIDGASDLLLNEQSWISINHGYVGEMFISDNNKLYCIIGQDPTSGPGIEIWQLGSGSNTFVAFEQISTYTNHQITGVFTTNAVLKPTTDYVYAAVRLRSGQSLGWLAIVNDDNHAIDIEQIEEDAFDISLCSSDYVYVAHMNSSLITQYNVGDETISTFNVSGNVYDLEPNLKKGYVYALHRGVSSNTISTITRNSATPFVSDLPIYSSSMKFNSVSDFLYVHVPYTSNQCTYGGTNIIEILDNTNNIEHIKSYTFNDEHRPRFLLTHTLPAGHSLILDNDNGYLYFGGGGHNLIHCLELPVVETLQLRENITWLSVPRHERSYSPFQTDTEIVFGDGYISGNTIQSLELAYNFIDPITLVEGEKYSDFIYGSGWIHGQQMSHVNSTRGYKLEIAPNQARTLFMFGDQESPYTTIDLYEDKSNWIGYFIEEEQDIFDALGVYTDDIYQIKHQDWTCIFTDVPWFGPSSPPGIEPRWYCDHQQTNIKYGEMVVVKPFDNVSGFQWNNPDQGAAGGALAMPQSFTYEEEPDYQTYVIALDSTDNPVEIGAFVGDTCIGACVVESQDTIAMIKGYNTGSTGDSISFEPYYGSKSTAKKRIKEYYVYNEQVNRSEKRAIQSGELKDVYFISFHEKTVRYVPSQNELNQLTVYPNPANSEFTIEFDIPQQRHLTISLFDLYGRLVKTVYNGTSTPGKHSSKVKLTDQSGMAIPEGLYILRMETNTGQITSQKIMVR